VSEWLHPAAGESFRKRSAGRIRAVFLSGPDGLGTTDPTPHFLVALSAAVTMLLMDASTVASALVDDNGALRVGVLVPFGAAWLIWNRRDQIRTSPVRTWWPGLVAIALTLAVWTWGEVAEINLLRQTALIAALWALVATVLGPAVVRALAVPLLFLLFAANVFFPLIPLLMQLSAQIGVHALRVAGVPAELSGFFILTPLGRWQVTEGCSGLDYALIYAMAACLYSSLAFHSTLRKVLFVFAAIAAAVLANGLRFWGIVCSAYLTDGVDMDHSLVGYVAFGIVFAVLFAIGYRLGQPSPQPVVARSKRSAEATSPLSSTIMASMAALALGATAASAVSMMEKHSRRQTTLDGCRQLQEITVQGHGASVVQARAQCSGPLGIKQSRSIAETTLHETAPNAALSTGTRAIEATRGAAAIDAATLTTLDQEAAYRLIYWYEVGDRATGSWVRMKWYRALALLEDRDATVTVVSQLEKLEKPH